MTFRVVGEVKIRNAVLLADVRLRIELANLVHPRTGIEADQRKPQLVSLLGVRRIPRPRWPKSARSSSALNARCLFSPVFDLAPVLDALGREVAGKAAISEQPPR